MAATNAESGGGRTELSVLVKGTKTLCDHGAKAPVRGCGILHEQLVLVGKVDTCAPSERGCDCPHLYEITSDDPYDAFFVETLTKMGLWRGGDDQDFLVEALAAVEEAYEHEGNAAAAMAVRISARRLQAVSMVLQVLDRNATALSATHGRPAVHPPIRAAQQVLGPRRRLLLRDLSELLGDPPNGVTPGPQPVAIDVARAELDDCLLAVHAAMAEHERVRTVIFTLLGKHPVIARLADRAKATLAG